ncbi:MAG: ComEC/Rec2 family competence protein, partial [Muribaculaceae bacterium]|nr:ComEC/Rec2 family competence protein [Muribaculaceae bacterium]
MLRPVAEAETVVPDEITYRTRGAVAECVLSSDAIVVTGRHPSVRSRIIDRILSLPLSDEAGSMLCALLVGHTDLITDGRREEFSAAGLSHLLALSGLHVGVISMLISVALWPLYVGRHNRSRHIITIAALWAFAAMTEFSPSVTRAVIMASVYLVGRIIERQSVPMNSLFFAAMIILCIWPDSLFEIGFQLSFAAVAGIILFYPLINCVDRRKHPWMYMLISYPAVSLSAMVFTGPVSSFYFHSYPLYFLLANLAVSPLVPLLIAAGALAVILSFAGFQVTWLCSAADWLCGAVNGIASFVASLPGHSAVGLYFSHWILCGIIISLLFLALGGWRRRIAPLIIGFGCMVLTAEVHALI